MSAEPAKRWATYEDVLAAPAHLVAEIIDGGLVLNPRPASPHTYAASILGADLGGAFGRGRGGPGGWVILIEPELHVVEQILVPDLAGWRRERMPKIDNVPFFTLAPDWVCEIVSPATEHLDRTRKMDHYASAGVRNLWLINPLAKILEVYRLSERAWVRLGSWGGDDRVRAEPFEAVELELGACWID